MKSHGIASTVKAKGQECSWGKETHDRRKQYVGGKKHIIRLEKGKMQEEIMVRTEWKAQVIGRLLFPFLS